MKEASSTLNLELQQLKLENTNLKQQVAGQQQDLQDSHRAIVEAKQLITTAQQENETAVKTFHETDRMYKVQIASLQEQLNDRLRELEDLKAIHTSRTNDRNQKERELQQTIILKEEKNKEVRFLITHIFTPF
jgi:hypothetical protein